MKELIQKYKKGLKKLKNFSIKKTVPRSFVCPLTGKLYYKDAVEELGLKELFKYHLAWALAILILFCIIFTAAV